MDAAQIRALKPRLDDHLAHFADCFSRCDAREHLAVYVTGQLSDLARKSVGPIAPAAGIPPPTLQEFLARYKWDEDALRRRPHHLVTRDHACPHSVGLIGETGDPKKGTTTPGVQRRHRGAVGKKDDRIVTVHLGYAADASHTRLDGELFLPESWSDDRPRRREAGVPGAVIHRPKTAIAPELYGRAVTHGVPFGWLTFDERYGTKPALLQALDGEDRYQGTRPENRPEAGREEVPHPGKERAPRPLRLRTRRRPGRATERSPSFRKGQGARPHAEGVVSRPRPGQATRAVSAQPGGVHRNIA